MCVPGLCPGQQDVPLPGGFHAGAVLMDPVGCWTPWGVVGRSRPMWSGMNVTCLLSLTWCHSLCPAAGSRGLCSPHCCCCSPGAVLPAAGTAPAPAPLPAELRHGRDGTDGHGEPLARSSHLWSVTASARGCMGSASLPKYSQGARASEGGVSWHQPLRLPFGGAGTVGSAGPQPPAALLPAEPGTFSSA